MKKVSVIAPSNIAFVKYWGLKNQELRLPENGSISMTLDNLTTTTTVEFRDDLLSDDVLIDGQRDAVESARVSKHLDRIRALAEVTLYARVVSVNSFPKSTGLSSSASGFAALTVAGSVAAGLNWSEREFSILARQGSGSACRSIPGGFVEWCAGDASESSFAETIFPSEHWGIVDLVALVSQEKKDVPTSQGMERSQSSLFFAARQAGLPEKLCSVRQAIADRDFNALGKLAEAEALEMHAVMMTSVPSLLYWTPETVRLMKLIRQWRSDGLPVYFTLNTGQDVHVLCEGGTAEVVKKKLLELEFVREVIVNHAGKGACLSENHLF